MFVPLVQPFSGGVMDALSPAPEDVSLSTLTSMGSPLPPVSPESSPSFPPGSPPSPPPTPSGLSISWPTQVKDLAP